MPAFLLPISTRAKSTHPGAHKLRADDAISILSEGKAEDIFSLDLQGLHAGKLGETMIVATGVTRAHMLHLARSVRQSAQDQGHPQDVPPIEGEESDDWMVLDLGSVVVHIMSPSGREYYELEQHWRAMVEQHSHGHPFTTDDDVTLGIVEDKVDAIVTAQSLATTGKGASGAAGSAAVPNAPHRRRRGPR